VAMGSAHSSEGEKTRIIRQLEPFDMSCHVYSDFSLSLACITCYQSRLVNSSIGYCQVAIRKSVTKVYNELKWSVHELVKCTRNLRECVQRDVVVRTSDDVE
jgi:hypothetical protein